MKPSTVNPAALPDFNDFARFTGLSLDVETLADIAVETASDLADGERLICFSDTLPIYAPMRLAGSRIEFADNRNTRFSVGQPGSEYYEEFDLGLANASLPFPVRLKKAKAILIRLDEERESAFQAYLQGLRDKFAEWSQHEDWNATLDIFDDREWRETEFSATVIFQRKEEKA